MWGGRAASGSRFAGARARERIAGAIVVSVEIAMAGFFLVRFRCGQGRFGSRTPVAARYSCRYKLGMSINTGKKEGRGRPAVDSEEVAARLRRDLLDGIDAYTAGQPSDSRPTRADVIRLALRDWLVDRSLLPRPQLDPEAVQAKIADLEAQAAALKHDGTPSPGNALKTMKRAVAKNDATKLRNKLAKAKGRNL